MEYERRQPIQQTQPRRTMPTNATKNLFMNVSVICGMAVVIAITVRLIMFIVTL